MARKEKHQTPTASGTLAHIRIHGVLHRRHFPHGTDQVRIKEWLLKTEMKYRRPGSTRTGRFADDARAYLEAVKAMPTYDQRKQHIEEWIAVFNERPRDGIGADEIRAQLHQWRQTMSAASVNKRRTALMHLYSVLDGKAERNPVRDAPKFAEPAPAPRAIPYPVVKALLKAMQPSKSKARLMVIAATGIPHAQLQQIQPEDVNLKAGTVAVQGRKKGAGTKGRIVPLTAEGIAAFKLMQREDAWGRFGRAPLRQAFRRACTAIKLEGDWTPYDLRHSFGTEVYRRSGDIRATQLLMDHSTPQLTHRYTLAAQDPRITAALASWAKVPRRVPKRKKTRKKTRKHTSLSRR